MDVKCLYRRGVGRRIRLAVWGCTEDSTLSSWCHRRKLWVIHGEGELLSPSMEACDGLSEPISGSQKAAAECYLIATRTGWYEWAALTRPWVPRTGP